MVLLILLAQLNTFVSKISASTLINCSNISISEIVNEGILSSLF